MGYKTVGVRRDAIARHLTTPGHASDGVIQAQRVHALGDGAHIRPVTIRRTLATPFAFHVDTISVDAFCAFAGSSTRANPIDVREISIRNTAPWLGGKRARTGWSA